MKGGGALIGHVIAVDSFLAQQDESATQKRVHFLSSALPKHIAGLSDKWTEPIFTSPETAAVLSTLTSRKSHPGVDPSLIHPLPLGVSHPFDGFTVQLLDANCLTGAVMFVFDGPAVPGTVLYTGDMRADRGMQRRFTTDPEFLRLSAKRFNEIFMDLCDVHKEEDLPSRQECLAQIANVIRDRPDAMVLIAIDGFGHEHLLADLADRVEMHIALAESQLHLFNLLHLDRAFVSRTDPDARIHVYKSAETKRRLAQDTEDGQFTVAIFLNETHLTNRARRTLSDQRSVLVHCNNHSTKREVHAFLSQLNFGKLTPLNARPSDETIAELLQLSYTPLSQEDGDHGDSREAIAIPAHFETITRLYETHSIERALEECERKKNEKRVREDRDWLPGLLASENSCDPTVEMEAVDEHAMRTSPGGRSPPRATRASVSPLAAVNAETGKSRRPEEGDPVREGKISDFDRLTWQAFVEYITREMKK